MWIDSDVPMSTVLTWAGLAPPAVEAVLEQLGSEPEDTFTMFAYTTPDEIEEFMQSVVIAEMPIGLGVKAKIRRAFKAVRFALGVDEPAAAPPLPTPVIV